ncbi:MAG TPA: hypothetical protein VJU54_10285 [Nitrospiraceae bacterium]|nr:hypothetical protein [Nitrospiraceae bacterium]
MSTVVNVSACGFLLCLGLSIAAQAEGMKAGQSGENDALADQIERTFSQMQEVHIIQGDVLRIDGTNYFIKGLDGKEVNLKVDNTTVKAGNPKAGDRIEAKINEQNHAVSILPAP